MGKKYHLFEVFGIELEYMLINSSTFKVAPIVDTLLIQKAGKLTADIDRIQYPSEVGFIQLRNNAPHARSVEKWYHIFGQVRNLHG